MHSSLLSCYTRKVCKLYQDHVVVEELEGKRKIIGNSKHNFSLSTLLCQSYSQAREVYKLPRRLIKYSSIFISFPLTLPLYIILTKHKNHSTNSLSKHSLKVEKKPPKPANFHQENYLPASFNTVEIFTKRTAQYPNLRQAELIRLLYFGFPNIDGCFCSIIRISFNISYCMLI